VIYILGLLSSLLKILPTGTALWAKIKGDKDKLDQIIAEGRQPTPEEWDALNVETAALEAQIDANAEQAGG
jgi:hypothetical protein